MKLRLFFAVSVFVLLVASPLRAQVGNNNPTGPAGAFNGQITTGCSYDPFTGSASRQISDLAVPGSVSYPLAFGRTSNSRGVAEDNGFGSAGAWRHSYSWSVEDSISNSNSNFSPTFYTVSFPDGRVITFTSSISDPYFRSSPGIPERFQPFNPASSPLLAYLILPDGGKIEFRATRQPPECLFDDQGRQLSCDYRYSYQAQAIIDPHGLRTVLGYNGDGSLNTITEPAGRWLQVSYVSMYYERLIDHVTSIDGRSVQYNYGRQAFPPGGTPYNYLSNVVYFGDSTLTAVYSYQAPNVGGPDGPPLLSTCDDSMYAGPMKRILYEYATGINSDQSAVVVGQIRSEKSSSGQVVSSLGVIVPGRTETRGDGPFRTFLTPANGYQITGWTDYIGFPFTNQQYDANGFLQSITNRNGFTTDITNDSRTGNPTSVMYPSTPSDPNNSRGTMATVYNPGTDPYYVASVTDENNKTTTYTRDPASHRVTAIDYPDANFYAPGTPAHEEFQYNNPFGLLTRHQRKNGNFEHFEYDTRGRLTQTWNPTSSSSLPASGPKTTITYYESPHPWADRVQTVTDPRGNPTTYAYEGSAAAPLRGRGLVSRITYPGGKYRTFVYDRVGNVIREENELRQPVEYVYDEYSRVTQLKVARPDPSNPSVQAAPPNQWDITYYGYTPAGGSSPLVRTARAVTTSVTAAGLLMTNAYDGNVRLEYQTRQNPGGVPATTQFHYDLVGNTDWVKDPRNKTTTIAYDQRNRKKLLTSPQVTLQDGTTTQYSTRWLYDPASNVRQILLPDGNHIDREYDPMNRL